MDLVSGDGARSGRMRGIRRSIIHILDGPGKKMNFGKTGVGKTRDRLSEKTLRAVTSVDESRNGSETKSANPTTSRLGGRDVNRKLC
jgi:hypothetical protein